MIDIGALYEKFNSEYNTHQAGFYRPDRDFEPAVNTISIEIFNALAGQYPRSQKIVDLLTPFQKSMNIIVEAQKTRHFAPFPPDYTYYASAGVLTEENRVCGEKECDVWDGKECTPFADLHEDFFPQTSSFVRSAVNLVPVNKWSAVTKHETKKPSFTRPYIKPVDKGFEVLPGGVGVIALDYYRLPASAVFAYKVRDVYPDTFLDYDKANSKQLEWSEALIPAFLHKLGPKFGLAVKDELILQVKAINEILV